MGTLYLAAAILIIFNILDSITTHIVLYKLPDHLRARESNPLMAKLFAKNYTLAHIIKHTMVFAGAIYLVISKDLYLLELIATMLGFVVLNNTYILIGRIIMGKRIDSPIRRLQKLLHIPDKLYYVLVALIITALSIFIVGNV